MSYVKLFQTLFKKHLKATHLLCENDPLNFFKGDDIKRNHQS